MTVNPALNISKAHHSIHQNKIFARTQNSSINKNLESDKSHFVKIKSLIILNIFETKMLLFSGCIGMRYEIRNVPYFTNPASKKG